MGLMSCAPAYVALVAEAQIDAGVRRGHPGGPGRRAGRPDARRHGRAAAPARQRHDGDPPRGRLAGRRHRARARRARARRASGPPSATRSTPSWSSADAARDDPHRDRRRALGDRSTSTDPDHRLHRRPAAVRSRAAPAVLARDATPCCSSCATPSNRSCASSGGCSRSFGGWDFSPILALIALQLLNSIVVEGIIHG